MKGFCGISGFLTLPSKQKTKEKSLLGDHSSSTSRQRIGRSLSFSESEKKNSLRQITRSESLCRLQGNGPGELSLHRPIIHPQPLSRSVSLVRLQPTDQKIDFQQCNNGNTDHAGIRQRPRRAESCRNLRVRHLSDCKLKCDTIF